MEMLKGLGVEPEKENEGRKEIPIYTTVIQAILLLGSKTLTCICLEVADFVLLSHNIAFCIKIHSSLSDAFAFGSAALVPLERRIWC